MLRSGGWLCCEFFFGQGYGCVLNEFKLGFVNSVVYAMYSPGEMNNSRNSSLLVDMNKRNMSHIYCFVSCFGDS